MMYRISFRILVIMSILSQFIRLCGGFDGSATASFCELRRTSRLTHPTRLIAVPPGRGCLPSRVKSKGLAGFEAERSCELDADLWADHRGRGGDRLVLLAGGYLGILDFGG